jgi:hypothetical protein
MPYHNGFRISPADYPILHDITLSEVITLDVLMLFNIRIVVKALRKFPQPGCLAEIIHLH